MASVRAKGDKWCFDRIVNGKRKNTTYDTEEQAQRALEEYTARLTLGLDVERPIEKAALKSDLTVGEAILKYTEVGDPDRPEQGKKFDQGFFDKLYHWLYDREIYYIDDVKAIHMEAYHAELRKEYAPASVNRIFQVYKPFFKTMLRWDLIAKNPTADIKVLEVESKQKKVWSKEDLERFETALPTWARPVVKFMGLTGCRPGQVASARFCDFDYDKRNFKSFSNKGRRKKKPVFPLNSEAMALVLEQRSKLRFRNSPDHLVFPGPSGEKFRPDYLYTAVVRVQERLGMQGYCPYGLRTSFGTRKVQEGVHLKVIAKLMGHSDTRTTEGYVGDISSEARSAVENDSWLTKTPSNMGK